MKTILVILRTNDGKAFAASVLTAVKEHLADRCGGCDLAFNSKAMDTIGLVVSTTLPARMLMSEVEPLLLPQAGGFMWALPLAGEMHARGNSAGWRHVQRHLLKSRS